MDQCSVCVCVAVNVQFEWRTEFQNFGGATTGKALQGSTLHTSLSWALMPELCFQSPPYSCDCDLF